MPESAKPTCDSKRIEHQWLKGRVLVFITHWGEKGDTLWVAPTYNSGVLERSRGRWGLTSGGAQNPNNWMERINFQQYNESIYAVTNITGINKISDIESEIAKLEEELSNLHVRLQQAKQKRLQTYRTVCKEFSTPVTSKDLVEMRDQAHNAGENTVSCLKSQSSPPLQTE